MTKIFYKICIIFVIAETQCGDLYYIWTECLQTCDPEQVHVIGLQCPNNLWCCAGDLSVRYIFYLIKTIKCNKTLRYKSSIYLSIKKKQSWNRYFIYTVSPIVCIYIYVLYIYKCVCVCVCVCVWKYDALFSILTTKNQYNRIVKYSSIYWQE